MYLIPPQHLQGLGEGEAQAGVGVAETVIGSILAVTPLLDSGIKAGVDAYTASRQIRQRKEDNKTRLYELQRLAEIREGDRELALELERLRGERWASPTTQAAIIAGLAVAAAWALA